MNKRYQIFISSTYADLKEERSKVIQTIMELDCIPAGMEIFPAIDEEQFNFIKRVIDDCDYYILIIGGRYGSISEDGLSYTEKEFEYALEKGLKVIAFIHGDPDSIPLGKSEKDAASQQKLQAFRAKVSTGRLVKFWTTADELPGLVSLSLSKTIKTYPAIGWIRGNSVTNPEVLQELNELRKENQDLKKESNKLPESTLTALDPTTLAGLDDSFLINGTYSYDGKRHHWEIKLTWESIFSILSPHLLDHPSDSVIKSFLDRELYDRAKERFGVSPDINDHDFQTIKIHLKSIALINVDYLETTKGGRALFWSLTSKGENLMMSLRSIKKALGSK